MAFHLAHIRDYSRFLAIDIGTYRVRVGAYSVDSGALKEMGFASIRQNHKNFINGSIADMRAVAQTIEQAILQASDELDHVPEDIILSFPSQAFVFDSITTQYVRADKASTLTMQEIDSMIKKIEAESFDRAHAKGKAQFGALSDDMRLVSSTIVSIFIDDKKVTNPIGFFGGNVRLTVLNVFAPASEFNIMRSIIASLGRRTISLIPSPLIAPKVVELTNYIDDPACYIDIGYTHTTVLVTNENEIRTFATFPVGAMMLMEMIDAVGDGLPFLKIEDILCSDQDVRTSEYSPCVQDFFDYILDMVWGFLEQEHVTLKFQHLFLQGDIFKNPTLFRIFGTKFETTCGYDLRKKRLSSLIEKDIKHPEPTVYGLALMASELLLVKKDPLVRILRYVLYNYE